MSSDYLADALGVATARLLELRLAKSVLIAAPGAGQNIRIPVPGGVIWELLTMRFTFTASAVVANRVPSVIFTDGDDVEYLRIPTHTNVAASQGFAYNFSQGVATEVLTSPLAFALPSPPIPLQTGWHVSTATSALDVGDNYTQIRIIVREWSESDVTQEAGEIVAQFDSLTQRLVTGR